MTTTELPSLDVLSEVLAVCSLPIDTAVPNWAWWGELTSVTNTDDELSLVCAADAVPDDVNHIGGWRALKVRGPLEFGIVGILAGISKVLADAGVSIFAISTYDTDYILMQNDQLDHAIAALKGAGYRIA